MATGNDTNKTTPVNKATSSYVASEIWDVNNGFAILHEMHHAMMSMEEIDTETLDRLLWVSGQVKAGLDEALKNAEAAAGIERKAA